MPVGKKAFVCFSTRPSKGTVMCSRPLWLRVSVFAAVGEIRVLRLIPYGVYVGLTKSLPRCANRFKAENVSITFRERKSTAKFLVNAGIAATVRTGKSERCSHG